MDTNINWIQIGYWVPELEYRSSFSSFKGSKLILNSDV